MGQFVRDHCGIVARLVFSLIALSIGIGASSRAHDFEPKTPPKVPAESLAAWKKVFAVLQHPRCMNCHQEDRPLQGDTRRPHIPPVTRSDDDDVSLMKCGNCHNSIGNNEMANVPGAPEWQLAPKVMAWQGRSSAEVCRQLIDEDRNRGRKPKDLITHMDHSLVLWGWKPGAGREPIPIEHENFVGLVAVWVHNGPECPP